MKTRRIEHGDLTLALHVVAGDSGGGAPTLLLVHELESSASAWTTSEGALWASWPGAVLALDLAGHGESDWRAGGAYTPELFAADVDATLADVGPCALVGAGVGAYVALLVGGARPDLVPAALLLPGHGLAGGGATPELTRLPSFLADLERIEERRTSGSAATDPLTHACATDLRPPDYARAFAARAQRLVLAEDGDDRPPWWQAIRTEASSEPVAGDPSIALAALLRMLPLS